MAGCTSSLGGGLELALEKRPGMVDGCPFELGTIQVT